MSGSSAGAASQFSGSSVGGRRGAPLPSPAHRCAPGHGEFGVVAAGSARGGIRDLDGDVPVAVKQCHEGAQAEEIAAFVAEAELMKRFRHPNIVRLLGVCTEKEPLLLIFELMDTDLRTFLRRDDLLLPEAISTRMCEPLPPPPPAGRQPQAG